MPIATIDAKSVKIDDDLTDLSWLIQMNNNKQRYGVPNIYNHENKNGAIERTHKPFSAINGQTSRSSIPAYVHDHQYSTEENQFYCQQAFNSQAIKRKYDSTLSYYPQPKRLQSEHIHPTYPSTPISSESYYFDHSNSCTQQKLPMPTASRCILLKNDASMTSPMPTASKSTNLNQSIATIEHKNVYSEDIEHLLDIFKNEVEMIGLDPVATTSTGDCSADFGHCLPSNEFCPY